MRGKKRALFLDRDGIVNRDRKYLFRPQDVEFCRGIFSLCKEASRKSYLIIIITNQSGVARGYYNEDDVERLHRWMKEEFKKRRVNITDIYYCPYYHDSEIPKYRKRSSLRKPEPGMIKQAVSDHNIDIRSSIMLGDKPSDRIKMKGLKSVILKSEYSHDNYDIDNLRDFKKYLR